MTATTNENDTKDIFLIVDDDLVLTQTLSRALKRRGCQVYSANNGERALCQCRDEPSINKVILDLKLEQESGLKLLPELLKINKQLEIVVLTGYSSIATAVEAIKLGAINYLCKPVGANEMIAGFKGEPNLGESSKLSVPSLERLEWEHIQKTLREHEGNISATARALNMHRRTLQRKLNKFPVKR